jgi:transposase
LGAASLFLGMFIRKNKNRSGSVSIQIISKNKGQYKVVKTVGCAKTKREEDLLELLAKTEMERIKGMQPLFIEHDDLIVEDFVNSIANNHLQIVGSELILGKSYQKFNFPYDGCCNYFRNLVLCRLIYPGSKLKTVAFYDMTTLYFEASEEDDFRIPGFNKDGKHQQPQIMIGLLVGKHGYPIGYQIFEGNTSETKTLIPVLESFQKKFNIEKPIVVADAALLSQKNINALVEYKYEYILGGRIKNEAEDIKAKIITLDFEENKPKEIKHKNGRLIVSFSSKRAYNDKKNRDKVLKRLEKRVTTGKLSKKHINNRGYNKYLVLSGELDVKIDYEKYDADGVWDGLKGYMTNTNLSRNDVIGNYCQLWQVEKAFRISKTDLRIRPIYHRLKERIEAHICICFTAYAIYKELERLLKANKIDISVEKAIEQIREIRQLKYTLPKSRLIKIKILQPTEMQELLLNMKI